MRANLFEIETALLTSRCVLRRFREGEGKPLYELVQNNQDYLNDHFPALVSQTDSAEGAESFVRRRLAAWLLQEDYSFGVWDAKSAQLIGFIRLFDIDWAVPKGELAYFLDRDSTGQGIMTEALGRVVAFCFRQLEMEKLYLHMLTDNYASQRLARKLGFGREGDLRNEFRRTGGTLVDLMRFGLTREEYGGD
jgi:RimJ/RimL family protein N-acetyltransferase